MQPDPIEAIPGWFFAQDRAVFDFFLTTQTGHGERGDLAELGTYLGKSAAYIGQRVQPGEVFTVIDLFEQGAGDDDNARENAATYPDLARAAFERNYLSVNRTLPRVIQGYSQTIVEHAAHGSHRFVHIDASHLYEHVRGDLAAARTLLRPGGVVACDDFRSAHAPGVAAAVWQEVTAGELRPILLTEVKLYGTFGDATVWRDRVREWLPTTALRWDEQPVVGETLLRVGPMYEDARIGLYPERPVWWKRAARAYLPPVLADAARRYRARR